MKLVLPVATGNAAKIELLQQHVTRWQLEAFDPGDAEVTAEPGYVTGASAKAERVLSTADVDFVLGHDSGYEFEALDGSPGPLTHRWLRTDPDLRTIPVGSGVTVVHCVALATAAGTTTWTASDRRVVRRNTTSTASSLPLTEMTAGPRTSLASVLQSALAMLDGIERAGGAR